MKTTLFKEASFIRNGRIVKGDILIENGQIQKIEPSLKKPAEQLIHEPNLFLLPGAIDPHVHFRDPGVTWKEDLETGSMAAVSGGITSFFEMPNTKPSTTTIERMKEKKKIASEKSIANYNFYIGATEDNLEECLGLDNIPGIKIYVGSSTGSLLVDKNSQLTPFFEQKKHLIAVHSEEESMVKQGQEAYSHSTNVHDHYLHIRTTEAAITCTQRLVQLAKVYNTRLHICHLTTKDEADYLSIEKKGTNITTEVCPQHLFLQAPDIYEKIGTYAQINPPIRDSKHATALWKALKNGTIDCMGTDHAPHTKEEKNKPFGQAPSGMPGVDTHLPLLLNQVSQKNCTLNDVQKWVSHQPAQLFGIKNKGFLEVGYDADIVAVDLEKKWTIKGEESFSKCKWSAFEGETITGKPIITFVNGNIVYREGNMTKEHKGKEILIKPLNERSRRK